MNLVQHRSSEDLNSSSSGLRYRRFPSHSDDAKAGILGIVRKCLSLGPLHVYMYTDTYTYICLYTYIYIRIYVHICIRMCMCGCVYTYICVCRYLHS